LASRTGQSGVLANDENSDELFEMIYRERGRSETEETVS